MSTSHLFPDDLIAALDGQPGAATQAHMENCTHCQAELDGLRRTLATVSRTDVPEPSPLFWDHLSARIQAATANEPHPAARVWRMPGWRGLFGLGALGAAALAVALWVQPAGNGNRVEQLSPDPSEARAVPAPPSPDAPWDAVSAITANLSADDVRVVVAAAPEFAPTVGELSPSEREAFVALLDAEFRGDAQ